MVLAQPLPGAGSELERIQRARLGDSDALEELITSHRTIVEQVARHFVSDHDDIDDIAQETWIRASQALGSLREEARFRPWLRAITRNACITFLSRRRPSDSLDAEDAPEPADPAADGPEASAEQRDERRRVWEALGALPELDRRALYLREVESLPFDELARRLGVRRNAAEVRVHRARARFRQLYEATDATHPACGMAGIRLALLLEGELHGETADAVERHLDACTACTQRVRTMAQGRSLYQRMGMFGIPGLSGLLERLQRAIEPLTRWVPVDAAPLLAENGAVPASTASGLATALAVAVIFSGPLFSNADVANPEVMYAPAAAAIITVPTPPDVMAPALTIVPVVTPLASGPTEVAEAPAVVVAAIPAAPAAIEPVEPADIQPRPGTVNSVPETPGARADPRPEATGREAANTGQRPAGDEQNGSGRGKASPAQGTDGKGLPEAASDRGSPRADVVKAHRAPDQGSPKAEVAAADRGADRGSPRFDLAGASRDVDRGSPKAEAAAADRGADRGSPKSEVAGTSRDGDRGSLRAGVAGEHRSSDRPHEASRPSDEERAARPGLGKGRD